MKIKEIICQKDNGVFVAIFTCKHCMFEKRGVGNSTALFKSTLKFVKCDECGKPERENKRKASQ